MHIPPETLQLIRTTNGALSMHEACALSVLAGTIPDDGIMCECGSAYGKSAVATASGYRGPSRGFGLIDPLYRNPEMAAIFQIANGITDASESKLTAQFFANTSDAALPLIEGEWKDKTFWNPLEPLSVFAWVLIDSGDHSYELAKSEVDFVAPRMVKGGLIVFHDFGNQFSGPIRVYKEFLAAGGFEAVNIPWGEIEEFLSQNGGESGNVSWHAQDNPKPQYLGALRKL